MRICNLLSPFFPVLALFQHAKLLALVRLKGSKCEQAVSKQVRRAGTEREDKAGSSQITTHDQVEMAACFTLTQVCAHTKVYEDCGTRTCRIARTAARKSCRARWQEQGMNKAMRSASSVMRHLSAQRAAIMHGKAHIKEACTKRDVWGIRDVRAVHCQLTCERSLCDLRMALSAFCSMHICVHAHVCSCGENEFVVCTCVCVCVYVCMHVYICVYVCVHVCMNV